MPGVLGALKDFFQSLSVPAYLVGGSLRDSLLGLQADDIDIAVTTEPFLIAEELARRTGATLVPLSPARQQTRVVMDHPGYGRWIIDISALDNSPEQDSIRRDFTIDAMALSVKDWDRPNWQDYIIDPLEGLADLQNQLIRAASTSVFRQDPARLLRAVRLSARLGFHLDNETACQIGLNAHLASSLPGDRVRNELLGILSSKGVKAHLRTLDNLGLLCCIIPELTESKGVDQPKEHYWDVFDHTLETVGSVERVLSQNTMETEPDPVAAAVPWNREIEKRFSEVVSDGHSRSTILKLAALLHDIAKPRTKMTDAKGKTRFLGHDSQGASISREIMSRLRVSNRGTRMVATMVENHLRPMQMSQGPNMPTPRAVDRYFRDVGDVAIDTLYLNLADHLAARGPMLIMEGWDNHINITEHILKMGTQNRTPERASKLITGHDLISELGLAPGPLLGSILEEIRVAQVAGEIYTRSDALELARRQVLQLSGVEGA